MKSLAVACALSLCLGSAAAAQNSQNERTRSRPDYGYSGGNEILDPAKHIEAQATPIFSGPQPGEPLPSFTAVGLRGDIEGEELDPIARAAGRPHLLLFSKGANGGRLYPLLGHQLGAIMRGSGRELAMSVIFLSDTPSEITSYMGRLAGRIPEFIDVALAREGADGPGSYGIDRNMTHTIIAAKDGTVVHNLPFSQDVFYNEPHILGAIADAMGVDHETLGAWLDAGERPFPERRRRR